MEGSDARSSSRSSGGPTSSASAGKILYWRKHNRVEVKDARYLDLDQIGGTNMPQILGSLPSIRAHTKVNSVLCQLSGTHHQGFLN